MLEEEQFLPGKCIVKIKKRRRFRIILKAYLIRYLERMA
jgi:hypothetical protein